MKINELLQDAVFQLNILLWMAKEQPQQNYRVRPLFYEHGFKIIYIEMPFPIPEETVKVASDSGLDIGIRPEPELILGHDDKRALYFEAKANSHGPDSSNARQAMGHLVATGPVFAEVLTPLESCLLCYLLPEEKRVLMSECLDVLSERLIQVGLAPGVFSTHGLAIEGDHLDYLWDSAFVNYLGLDYKGVSIINDIENDTDPSPLILVFSDEDCSDTEKRDFYRQVVLDQARASLICELHNLPVGEDFAGTPDTILMQISDGVFQYLNPKRQAGLRRLIRTNLFKRIHENWNEKQPGIVLVENELRFRWDDLESQETFLDWLEDRRMHFSFGRPPEDQPKLF